MKKLGFITIGLILFYSQVFAQNIGEEKDPDEQIIVNKKYDEDGNLIQYDSTYVHQWSSDSTFNFSIPNDQFFPGNNRFFDLDEFFKKNFEDSVFENSGSHDFFGNIPFNNEEFFEQFFGGQPDSSLMWGFSHNPDSLIQNFHFSPPGFPYRDLGDFEKQLNEMLNNFPLYDFQMPQFRNDEQQKEWEELLEKHQKEMEDLKRKWDNN